MRERSVAGGVRPRGPPGGRHLDLYSAGFGNMVGICSVVGMLTPTWPATLRITGSTGAE